MFRIKFPTKNPVDAYLYFPQRVLQKKGYPGIEKNIRMLGKWFTLLYLHEKQHFTQDVGNDYLLRRYKREHVLINSKRHFQSLFANFLNFFFNLGLQIGNILWGGFVDSIFRVCP